MCGTGEKGVIISVLHWYLSRFLLAIIKGWCFLSSWGESSSMEPSLWFLPSLPALCQLQTCSHCTRNCSSLFRCCLLSLISKDYTEAQLGWMIRVTLTALLVFLCPYIVSHLGLIAACLGLGCVFMSLHSRSKHLTRAHRSCSSRINENILEVWQHSKGSLGHKTSLKTSLQSGSILSVVFAFVSFKPVEIFTVFGSD